MRSTPPTNDTSRSSYRINTGPRPKSSRQTWVITPPTKAPINPTITVPRRWDRVEGFTESRPITLPTSNPTMIQATISSRVRFLSRLSSTRRQISSILLGAVAPASCNAALVFCADVPASGTYSVYVYGLHDGKILASIVNGNYFDN